MADSAQPALPAALFAEILDRTQVALVGFARGLLGNGEDARDLVQDVYVEAWRLAQRRGPPFTAQPDPTAVDRWLYLAAYHRAISLLRHRRVIAWEPLDPDQVPEPAGRTASLPFEDRVAESASLRSALASLEPEDAACLLLNLVQGYSAVEIARTLEITPEAARKRTSRALQRLRAAYHEQNPAGGDPPSVTAQTVATPPHATWKRAES